MNAIGWGFIIGTGIVYVAIALWNNGGRDLWKRHRAAHYRWLRYQELMKAGYSHRVAWYWSKWPRATYVKLHEVADSAER